ncbi:hypothetical protein Tco_0400570 [Tanacetum coccineum]
MGLYPIAHQLEPYVEAALYGSCAQAIPSPDYVRVLSPTFRQTMYLEPEYPEYLGAIWTLRAPIKDADSMMMLHLDDLPEADMSLQKRARFTAPTSRFEIGESSLAAAARHAGNTLAHRVDYGFVNTVKYLVLLRGEDAQDDRAFIGAHVSILRRERRYFRLMDSSYEREAVIARQAWSHSKSRIQAMEA